ncbi:MAG: UDP-N-acetylmuramoyl-L-alanyl-D-glutamate--2,6-diaminopimelate ligase [Prevotella sp.]|jgi:UDP-N-acetylmuramoyl-L-alanyl-D-glutamate--2,6-diaminopimelate ligase|nr:UDP-N-acetylmuramoyl-L-alanyl-D-glutamate--2,6-diaminopimelate ligase [Prevotella sp.]
MKLSDIIKDIQVRAIQGSADVEIVDVDIDSRRVKEGHLFVAIPGTQTDGHQYVGKALEQGAVAVLCEHIPEGVPTDKATFVVVDSTEAAIGPVATAFQGYPTQKLKLVGVTGTNGKTTIATLLYNLFRSLGYRCGLLSTVCNYIEGEPIPASHTTPDPVELNRLLRRMVDEGCEYAFMECSSHAIAQQRIGGLKFAGGIFTNLTRDHLDYHKTVENYRNAKKAFFDMLPKGSFAITNADDKNGLFMVQNTKATVKTYSTRSMGDFRARLIECHFEGMYLDIDGHEVGVQFIGKFNVSNLLAVYATAVMLGQQPEDVLVVLSTLKSVAGRLEPIHSPEGFTAIVDYAHTPDALENVLRAIHEVLQGKGHVITVCGAGGNRDKGKRPLMAQEAVAQSDRVIITSDNPRFEEPQDIINDMLAGLDNKQMKKVVSIVDRREAIRTATMMAQKGDVILIAGKGHEDYQEIKGVKHHFDDREIVREIFGEA